jgi:hypothetical protein
VADSGCIGAPDSSLGARRRGWLVWLVASVLIVGLVLVVGLVLWAAFVQPPWLVSTSGLKGADLARAQNDFRGTMLTALGGLALIIGAVVGAVSLRETTRQNRAALEETQRQNRAAAERDATVLEVQRRGQVTERFTRAIDQLGQGGVDVRIGAAYVLEQIARDSVELHWPIMEVLTAYLREHAPVRSADRVDAGVPPGVSGARTPADLQAIATVIGRRDSSQDPTGQRLDLHKVDLRYVQWAEAQLKGADLRETQLDWANLTKAQLTWAELQGAQLEEADLSEVDLSQVRGLTWAGLQRASNVDLGRLPPDIQLEAARASQAEATEPTPDRPPIPPAASGEE